MEEEKEEEEEEEHPGLLGLEEQGLVLLEECGYIGVRDVGFGDSLVKLTAVERLCGDPYKTLVASFIARAAFLVAISCVPGSQGTRMGRHAWAWAWA